MGKFQEKGFVVLGFPCNQFGVQEPCKNEEILPAVENVRPGKGFKPNFPLFKKIEVNGENAHPLFAFLKEKIPKVYPIRNNFWVFDQTPPHLAMTRCLPEETQWNFEKFLCDRQGKPVQRFSHTHPLDDVEKEIAKLVEQ